uniref:Uncharacterized protein n=1 Tax=Anopheles farauti TaxID=69004 RepID=A0A182QIS2_9DIPT
MFDTLGGTFPVSMSSSGKRQLGSNALAKSSSFNSSGRSSNCDTAEDMYSDVSLEDVQDINHKVCSAFAT